MEDFPKTPFESKENPNEVKRKELEAQGWQRASGGLGEMTHQTKLNDQTRFVPVEFRKKQDIEKEYLDKYGEHGFNEVLLVPRYIYKEKLGWIVEEHTYDVYLRRPQDSNE